MSADETQVTPADFGELRLLLQSVSKSLAELRADVLPLVNARSGDLARLDALRVQLDESHHKHREHFAWREDVSRRLERMERDWAKQLDRIEGDVGKLSVAVVTVSELKITMEKWRDGLEARVAGIDTWRNQLIGKLAMVAVFGSLGAAILTTILAALLRHWIGG